MNNENGKALLARVRAGDLVTLRMPDGSQFTGRAWIGLGMFATGADGRALRVTESNILRIDPRKG